MYNNGLYADPAEINSDGRQLVAHAEELLAELNDFDKNKNSLTDIWHGESADAFTAVYEEEMTKLKRFQEMLNAKGEALQTASGHLSDAEDQNTMGASKLGN